MEKSHGRLIEQDCTGEDVRAVQDALNFHIRRLTPLAANGNFGKSTYERLIEFQRANGLTENGVVEPNTMTMAKLFAKEQLSVTLALVPQKAMPQQGFQPPRLIPSLTPSPPPPAALPIFLSPGSSFPIPALTPAGQAISLRMTVPVRSDPADPSMRTYTEIARLLNHLPQSFSFNWLISNDVRKPVQKARALSFDPPPPRTIGGIVSSNTAQPAVRPLQCPSDPILPMQSGFPSGFHLNWPCPISPMQSGLTFRFDDPKAQPFEFGTTVRAQYVIILSPGPKLQPQVSILARGDLGVKIDWPAQDAKGAIVSSKIANLEASIHSLFSTLEFRVDF
jgi:peptidoglycan hydrolase-like protein with peptidoglycan-binding domain